MRFTPAHAGNTLLHSFYTTSVKVHPRPCGEYKSDKHIWKNGTGSPPPMRGILPSVN